MLLVYRPVEKYVNLKTTAQISLYGVGNKKMDIKLNPGLVLIGFRITGPVFFN